MFATSRVICKQGDISETEALGLLRRLVFWLKDIQPEDCTAQQPRRTQPELSPR